ncbi:RcnB family protein [Sphingomonas sp. ASY06-1R]|uniref:RcnB family protein n=1 Tax=Sphingomonas sp. ASY06-1R TaxID=3445771 RepID=UPI003FA21AD5
MNRFKLALLAATAVLAVTPAAAQGPDRNDRHAGRDGGFRDGGQRGNMRPTPPQAQVQQPQPRPQPQAGAPSPQQQRGDGGRNRFSGQSGDRPQWRGDGGRGGDARAPWAQGRATPDRGNGRPAPPQAVSPGQPQDRGQWGRGRDGQVNRNDGQPRPDRGWRGGDNDRRGNDGRWDRGNRDRDDNRDRQWNNDGRNDRRWNTDGRGNDGGRWDRDGRRDNDRRWDDNRGRGDDDRRGWRGDRGGRPNLNWRNDHRYDWRSWRNSHRNVFYRGRYNAPYGYGYRSISRGFMLEPYFYASNYWLNDPYEYRLPPVEWPYRWVRYFEDAVLVDTNSGEVVDVIQGFFF